MILIATEIKKILFQRLVDGNYFWSYDLEGVTGDNISDEFLISQTLLHLDITDINLLFSYYKQAFIKKIWREQIAIHGDYYRTLNVFYAWYYFKIKRPERYLKMIETKHWNKYD
jgi:hypothetical protein